jgi:hypothetical protein
MRLSLSRFLKIAHLTSIMVGNLVTFIAEYQRFLKFAHPTYLKFNYAAKSDRSSTIS